MDTTKLRAEPVRRTFDGASRTMARIRARSSHIGVVRLSCHVRPSLSWVGCALNPSDSGQAAPSISGIFPGLPEVCTKL